MSAFLSKKYEKLVEYTPGEQPQDRKYLKLNTNESPFPPSPLVIKAINEKEVEDLRLYSDPDSRELKAKLALYYGVKSENIFVSNGSDDILNFAFMAFAGNGVVYPDISYGFYPVFAALHGDDAQEIPLDGDFKINPADYMNKKKMVVLANPNAPTGISLGLDDIEKIVASNKDSVVLIDEAYVDFGGESCYKLTEKYNNLLVAMTFSKSRSMAGARLGFAIAGKEIISDLEKIKYSTNPYNVNRLTQRAGIAALCDKDYFNENCNKIIKAREYTIKMLRSLGFTVTDSKANFIFAKSDKIGGKELYLKLKERGILVRHFDKERICDYNRITIGSQGDMETLIKTIGEIIGG